MREREESKELGGFTAFPGLILMDGGKGQVNVAQQVLDELHLHIPVCGMVKDDHHRTRGLYLSLIHICLVILNISSSRDVKSISGSNGKRLQ